MTEASGSSLDPLEAADSERATEMKAGQVEEHATDHQNGDECERVDDWNSAHSGMGVNPMRGKLEDIRDVTKGLWFWRVRHPGWKPEACGVVWVSV